MVLKFFNVILWICLLPLALLAMVAGFSVFTAIAIIWFLLGLGITLAAFGASIVGSIFFGAVGIDTLGSLFQSDLIKYGFEISCIPGSWWLTNFNQAWNDLQEESEFSSKYSI
jgi:hypothetical protein